MELAAGILGTGSALPEKVITNFDLEKMVETSDQWITERTGIKERHRLRPQRHYLDAFRKGLKKSPRDGGHQRRKTWT